MQIHTNKEDMIHSARAPIDKSSDSYSRKFSKRDKNGSIGNPHSKDKISATTSRHLRTNSRNSFIPTPNSSSNLSCHKQKVPFKKRQNGKKSSRSNPRKGKKSSNSQSTPI